MREIISLPFPLRPLPSSSFFPLNSLIRWWSLYPYAWLDDLRILLFMNTIWSFMINGGISTTIPISNKWIVINIVPLNRLLVHLHYTINFHFLIHKYYKIMKHIFQQPWLANKKKIWIPDNLEWLKE